MNIPTPLYPANPPACTGVLPQLADPATYQPCKINLKQDPDQRRYWLDLFKQHFLTLIDEATKEGIDAGVDEATLKQNLTTAQTRFFTWLDEAESPDHLPRLDVLTICYAREQILREQQIKDPYRLAKHEQNQQVLPLLPKLLAELDADATDRVQQVIKGVFAGNIFDLGAPETVALFASGQVDFNLVRDQLKPRPWLFDGLTAFNQRLQTYTHQLAILFVDNAGPDICLGMLPLARFLLQRGTRVVLTANTSPALNDVTIDELDELITQAAELDETFKTALKTGDLRCVPSGNNAPLIDLTRLSDELIEICQKEPVDLVVLEGMGRGVESNFDVKLTCDTLNLAMLKDAGVAETLGGTMYDLVCRYAPGEK